MKIAIYVNNLRGTGAPKVLIELAKSFIIDGNEVFFIVDENEPTTFYVPEDINIYYLGFNGLKLSNRPVNKKINIFNKTFNYIKRKLKAFYHSSLRYPNLVNDLQKKNVSVILNNNILSNFDLQTEFNKVSSSIICVHMDPFLLYNKYSSIPRNKLDHFFKNQTAVCVSNDASKKLLKMFPSIRSSKSIYNILDKSSILKHANEELLIKIPRNYFVYVGGLIERKKVCRIIKSLLYLDSEYHLLVLGDGDKKDFLISLAKRLGLTERIHFLGFITNPYPYIKSSLGLLLTSDAEGLPTVIIESFYLNVPVISTDCPTGPREILIDEFSQYLVPLDQTEENIVSHIVKLLEYIISDPKELPFDKILNNFSHTKIKSKWYDVFKEMSSIQ